MIGWPCTKVRHKDTAFLILSYFVVDKCEYSFSALPVRVCILNPLTSELPQLYSPPDTELSCTTLFVTVFVTKLPISISAYMGINQRAAGQYFGLTGICQR